jgi:hypothetical protein
MRAAACAQMRAGRIAVYWRTSAALTIETEAIRLVPEHNVTGTGQMAAQGKDATIARPHRPQRGRRTTRNPSRAPQHRCYAG